MGRFFIIGIATVAALGGFIYGVDSGIIATTLGHDTFKLYMYGPPKTNTALSGAVVSVYNAGQAIGSLSTGALADTISRKWTIFIAAVLAIIGTAIQAGAIHIVVQKDRFEEASRVLTSFHGDDHDLVAQELIQIREQIRLEKLQSQVSWFAALRQLFSRQYLRRTATATFILAMTQLSGSSVIQNFQNIFYATVGFEGQQALLISGIYGLMGVIGQAFYLVVVADRWPRARTLSTGSVVLAALIAVCMALSAVYGQENNTNLDGARGAIAFIFIYSAAYAVFFNGTVWVVCSELFPFFLRSRGIAISVFMQSVVAIVLSQITPIALAQVSWRYYALFIATNLAAGIIYIFFLPETAGKSLEEVGELFGDTLATDHIGAIDVASKHGAVELEEVEEPVSSQMKSTM
ncbi:transporter (major facilitator superfamily) [Apiospora arundinis]